MKKNCKLSGFIATFLITIFFIINNGFAENGQYLLKNGERAEEIEGILHKVETFYGPPLVTDIDAMLKKLGTEAYPEDRVSFFPYPEWGMGGIIIIKRANVVKINDGGEEKLVRTWKITVGEVLEENNISIGKQDKLNCEQNAKLTDLNGMEIAQNTGIPVMMGIIIITRVAETEIKEKKEIDFKTVTKKDPELEKGKTKIESQGKKGLKELTYRVRRENGKEISRELIKSEVIREPENKIILEGTKIIVLGTGKATWYDLVSGMSAASDTLPYGTMVHVVNTENGKSVDVKIIDHGIQGGAIIDLSKEAFEKLAPLGKGVIQVRLERP